MADLSFIYWQAIQDGLEYDLVETINNYNVNLNESYDRIRSSVQAVMGFTWHMGFNDDKQHLYISAGYEFNQWFQQIDSFYSTDATRTEKREGDLGLQGLTFDVRFDF